MGENSFERVNDILNMPYIQKIEKGEVFVAKTLFGTQLEGKEKILRDLSNQLIKYPEVSESDKNRFVSIISQKLDDKVLKIMNMELLALTIVNIENEEKLFKESPSSDLVSRSRSYFTSETFDQMVRNFVVGKNRARRENEYLTNNYKLSIFRYFMYLKKNGIF